MLELTSPPVIAAALLVLAAGLALAYKKTANARPKVAWDPVEPVEPDFDWREQTATKHRPFKKVYHVTMSLQRTNRQDWLKIEDTYGRVSAAHRRIMDEHPDTTCMVQESKQTDAAIREMYDYVVDTISSRYPMCFKAEGNVVLNTISGAKFPRTAPKKTSPRELLRILGANVEEDIFVLQYDPEVEEYRLRATTGIAGLGFEWREKVGLKLTDIHDPVPQYREKLQKSMNRYFQKVVPNQFVQRVTFGLALSDINDLYSSGNLHFDPEKNTVDLDNIDFENQAFVRLERQVLTRLPVSGFLGFSIRTYMYSLADIKREGMGDICADAFEAWGDDTAVYKGRHLWGKPVISYLRGSSSSSESESEKEPERGFEKVPHMTAVKA